MNVEEMARLKDKMTEAFLLFLLMLSKGRLSAAARHYRAAKKAGYKLLRLMDECWGSGQ